MANFETVQLYLDTIDPKTYPIFDQVRKLILTLDPKILEYSGYGILGFKLNKHKFYIGGYKTHIGLYPGSELIQSLKDELKDYKTSKGTIHIPLDKPLPTKLIILIASKSLGIIT